MHCATFGQSQASCFNLVPSLNAKLTGRHESAIDLSAKKVHIYLFKFSLNESLKKIPTLIYTTFVPLV